MREREREREREGDLVSWSLAVDFFSTPRTMVSVPRTPTAALPLRTASRAYSTWNKWPSGEKTVIALSYLAILRLLQLNSTDLLSLCLFLKTILKLSLTHCVFLIANLNLSHKATHPLKSCCVVFLTRDPEKLDRIR